MFKTDSLQGAIFDLDGTLLDSLSVRAKIDVLFLQKRGIEVDEEYTRTVTALGFRDAAAYTVRRYNLSERPEDLIAEWVEMARRAYAEDIRLKPGAAEYLAGLREAGVRLGIATALHPENIEDVLANNGIREFFEGIATLTEVSRGKGFPDIYLLAASKIGLAPEHCVVFEDILLGIRGAKAGGFKVVGVLDEYSRHDFPAIREAADHTIGDFTEMLG